MGSCARIVAGVALALAAFALALLPAACSPRAAAQDGPSRADTVVPQPAPTQSYDGRAPAPADRRPIEQNPECWIADPGWPRCSELENGTDTDG